MTQPNNGFDLSAVQFRAESSEIANEPLNSFTEKLNSQEIGQENNT